MGFWRYLVFATLLYCGIGTASLASAQSINLSNDPVYAQDFYFFCPPYKFSFEDNKHYLPAWRSCTYSIPAEIRAAGSQIVMELYYGVLGNATLLRTELVFDGTFIPTLVKVQDPATFDFYPTPHEEDGFFAVVLPSGPYSAVDKQYPELEQFHAYFSASSASPPHQNYRIIRWKWGSKPASEFDPVVIIPGILGSWEKNGQWLLDPILHTYDNLIDTLLANGYIEGHTLFTFPYDWRNSNVLTATLLGNKIEEIKDMCDCKHVDLVGHSMGGLVAGQYIASDEYADDVDQAVFIATPFLGAPKTYKIWESGELDFDNRIKTALIETIFKKEAKENGFTNIFNYIRGKPISSIQELLPVYWNYLTDEDSTVREYPAGYPRNTFLEEMLPKLAQEVFQERVSYYSILADDLKNQTIGSFVVKPSTQLPKWEHGEPTETRRETGDGTVPRYSIENIFGYNKDLLAVDHTEAASTSVLHIFRELNKRDLDVMVGKNYSANIPFLIIQLLSPIDMQIVAPDGKRLGKDFLNNQELSEIPDSFYSGFLSNNEYAVIRNPLPGTYKIHTVGTGDGTYTIVADYITEASTTEAETMGTTTSNEAITHTLALSSTTSMTLVKETSFPPIITPESCVSDMQTAYRNKWITKKSVYSSLVTDCKLLKVLFTVRDKAKNNLIRKGIILTIKNTLDHMDKLATDKSNEKEAVELITKNTIWLRQHELK